MPRNPAHIKRTRLKLFMEEITLISVLLNVAYMLVLVIFGNGNQTINALMLVLFSVYAAFYAIRVFFGYESENASRAGTIGKVVFTLLKRLLKLSRAMISVYSIVLLADSSIEISNTSIIMAIAVVISSFISLLKDVFIALSKLQKYLLARRLEEEETATMTVITTVQDETVPVDDVAVPEKPVIKVSSIVGAAKNTIKVAKKVVKSAAKNYKDTRAGIAPLIPEGFFIDTREGSGEYEIHVAVAAEIVSRKPKVTYDHVWTEKQQGKAVEKPAEQNEAFSFESSYTFEAPPLVMSAAEPEAAAEPFIETSSMVELMSEQPVFDETIPEDHITDEPPVEETIPEEPITDEPPVEETIPEETIADEPPVEDLISEVATEPISEAITDDFSISIEEFQFALEVESESIIETIEEIPISEVSTAVESLNEEPLIPEETTIVSEPEATVISEPEPEPESPIVPEPEPEATVISESEPESPIVPGPEPEPEATVISESEPEATVISESESEPEATVISESEPESPIAPEPEPPFEGEGI